MSKVLILFAHPAFQKSRAQKHLVAATHSLDEVTFHDLYEAYPDFNIDVPHEQQLLRDHDLIVLQHPFYWYSCPALLKEWLEDGIIGPVEQVYAWTDRPVGGNPWSDFAVKSKSIRQPAMPHNLNWDLWLGPAQSRAYHPDYHPKKWRAWLDFGTGALGDMGCHIIDPAVWALDLGFPETIEATSTHWEPDVASQTYPRASLVEYKFPARGDKPPVTLNWSDGRLLPRRPDLLPDAVELPNSGALLIGRDGVILHGSHGASGLRVFPESKFQNYLRPEKSIPRVKGGQQGHHQDWIRACKDGKASASNFEYGAALTQIVLLGVLAIRAKNRKLHWDTNNFAFKNDDEANALIHSPYRDGWVL